MSQIGERLRKSSLFLRPWNAYWRLSDPGETLAMDLGPLGPYPLDFRPRLDDGHYPTLDSAGVPLWPDGAGGWAYQITTMTSCALARWHRFVSSGDERWLAAMLPIADRLARVEPVDGELHLFDQSGPRSLSAMSQGEAMSVLCRAWRASGQQVYLDAAAACLGPFRRSIDNSGVVGRFAECGPVWFEERTRRPLHHILNGMIYAVWGLADLAATTREGEARDLAEAGVLSVAAAAPRFDAGWWSRYWVPEIGGVEYPASVMYQALHVCQLTALGRQRGSAGLGALAHRFRRQMDSPIGRVRAAVALAAGKRRLRRLRAGGT